MKSDDEIVIVNPEKALACAVIEQAFLDLRSTICTHRYSAERFLTNHTAAAPLSMWSALAGMDAAWIADRARAIMQEAV